jgi:hypothetical protein
MLRMSRLLLSLFNGESIHAFDRTSLLPSSRLFDGLGHDIGQR